MFQRLSQMALVVSDGPGLVVPVWHDLTYLSSFAILVASIPKGGRALPVGWHNFHRDLHGEAFDGQNRLVDWLVSQVLAHISATLTTVIAADREFARATFFRRLQAQQCDFVIRVDKETWMTHTNYEGAMASEARSRLRMSPTLKDS